MPLCTWRWGWDPPEGLWGDHEFPLLGGPGLLRRSVGLWRMVKHLSLSLLMITCRSAKMSNSFSFQENYIRLDQCLQYFKKKLKEIHNKTVNLTNFLNIVYIFSTKILNTVFVHKDFFFWTFRLLDGMIHHEMMILIICCRNNLNYITEELKNPYVYDYLFTYNLQIIVALYSSRI